MALHRSRGRRAGRFRRSPVQPRPDCRHGVRETNVFPEQSQASDDRPGCEQDREHDEREDSAALARDFVDVSAPAPPPWLGFIVERQVDIVPLLRFMLFTFGEEAARRATKCVFLAERMPNHKWRGATLPFRRHAGKDIEKRARCRCIRKCVESYIAIGNIATGNCSALLTSSWKERRLLEDGVENRP